MKKIFLIIICLLLNSSAFATTLSERFNSFLDPIENFNKKETMLYRNSFDKTNEEFKFDCLADCVEILGFKEHSGISKRLRGKTKTPYKGIWLFEYIE